MNTTLNSLSASVGSPAFANSLYDNPLVNVILMTDSYKLSHFLQYPTDAGNAYAYGTSRGGAYSQVMMAGMQMILASKLMKPITAAMVQEAKQIVEIHGLPFNFDGWMSIVNDYNGYLPISIKALPEGLLVPSQVPLYTVESLEPRFNWVVSYVEPLLLQVWYPCTVATLSKFCKSIIAFYLQKTSDDPQQIDFKLHDFGLRGASSIETAAIGGWAHLINFLGTDTLPALLLARQFYQANVAGYSIPASEHSTTTSHGKEGEFAFYDKMLNTFGHPNALFAMVMDSYDLFKAIDYIGADAFKAKLIASKATLVVRPDSGDPVSITLQVVERLAKHFGFTVNSKGYKVLNHVRMIQGDGVNPDSIRAILANFMLNGWAADNIAFGMGGGLLQQVNRDTLRFAQKLSAVEKDGQWVGVFKDPTTDSSKRSMAGRFEVVKTIQGTIETRVIGKDPIDPTDTTMLCEVYRAGTMNHLQTMDQIKALAASQTMYVPMLGNV